MTQKEKGLIIYFVPPEKVVNGGIMSIFSQCEESRRFTRLHHSETALCVYPGNDSYGKNDLFENNETVYTFEQIVKRWPKPEQLIIHLPETAVRLARQAFKTEPYSSYLRAVPKLQINVMTQNIDLARSPAEFSELFLYTPNVTQTTAHSRYATQELSNRYQTPVHHLSVFCDKSQYHQYAYNKKENLIVYSSDERPEKVAILHQLQTLENYTLKEIRGLKYHEYKDLIGRAKFCLTFGEGFDGYFIESYFSGSIGVAVYNERFFPNKDFAALPSVFDSYSSFEENIVKTIRELDNQALYDQTARTGLNLVEELYKYKDYIAKIERFYKRDYDFQPEAGTAPELIQALVVDKEAELARKEILNKEGRAALKAENEQLRADMERILNSKLGKVANVLSQPRPRRTSR